MADSPTQQRDPEGVDVGRLFLQDINSESLSGAKSISNTDPQVHVLDPNGSNRDVNLPADEQGLLYLIVNDADADEDLQVKESGGTLIHDVLQDEAGLFYNTGSGWVVLAGDAASNADQEV